MSIHITVDLEALKDVAVHEAVLRLLDALRQQAPRATKPVAAAPLAPSPSPSPLSPSPLMPAKLGSAPRPALGYPPAPPPRLEAPRPAPPVMRRTPKPQQPIDQSLSDEERYEKFVEQLPERSKRFLELVQRKGTLTINDAMDELGITVPKAMGGITGSIGRWAPVRGVQIPYEAITVRGDRAWRWTGGAPSTTLTTDNPTQLEGGEEDMGALPTAAQMEQLLNDADLPEKSRAFLELLKARGQLTRSEVLEHFNLSRAKAIGGVTEPLQRIGREQYGISKPFTSGMIEETGEKLWRWPLAAEALRVEASSSDEAEEEPATTPGVRVRKRNPEI
ncbi:hypothetical protein KKF91_21725 [Myxococcota bacterium]|nr:hypothetical protein [Myxococcota bacterium]MBU1433165.1 hypothetical protein [Myxococcota bacterium]MBU1899714.1 hypothetical protein [Myxococcota bacterium]